MELMLALLADCANVTADGKLNMMGIFEQLYAPQFPAVHASMQLVMRIEATPFESGVHPLRVAFSDADARELFAVPGTLAVPESRAGENVRVNQIFVFNGLVLPQPGRYEFIVSAGADELGRVPLHVATLPQAAAPH
ncbi:MAG: hypothetical protein HZB53_18365 [Chloroflexi bacterium]|nr:hypothetical protein [Chloroflexota bacterium]